MKNNLVLRPYQQECLDKILWERERELEGNSLCILPTGAGKSVVIANLVHTINEPVLILQPTKEILEQNLDKLLRYVDRSEVGVYSASMDEKTVNQFTLATIGSIYKKPEFFKHFKLVVIDECFVAGTIVSGKKIEDIQIGDMVNTYNHKTGYIEPKKVLAVSKKWSSSKLININKDLIISTSNHPIYTYEKGYQKAEEIAQGGVGDVSSQNDNKIAFYKRDLQGVSKRHYSGIKLQYFGRMDYKKTSNESSRLHFLFKKMQIFLGSSYKFKKNDIEQSNEIFKERTKNERNFQKNWLEAISYGKEGWEWTTLTRSTVDFISNSWSGMAYRICNSNREWLSTTSLQNRHSKPYKENRRRSGWLVSFFNKSKRERQEKGRFIELKRVESVSIQQRRSVEQSTEGCWVYNLEVEDNHNYFANGVLVHNCHLVNPRNLDGMFTTFLEQIGNPKVIGFTATPYRIEHKFVDVGTNWKKSVATIKLINRMRGNFWRRILYNVNVQDLIDWNYLCPLEYHDKSFIDHENIPVNKSQSDFNLESYEEMIREYGPEILKTITYAQDTSKSVLVFCSSVAQAEELAAGTKNAEVVSAETNKKERERIINGFKDGSIQTVFNVGVLTTGFDHPALDCIVLLRPTRSVGLYYQMVGRGVRIAPGKTTCKVIDLTSTVKNIGKVEGIRLVSGKETESGKYELMTETGSWHNRTLYEFVQQVKWGKKKVNHNLSTDVPF